MEEQAILCLGAFTLIGSGAELVRLHRGNPLLRGLNLMGQAILVGGFAAALLFAGTWVRIVQPLGTLLILLAFSLCHWALGQLADPDHQVEWITKLLFVCQALATPAEMTGLLSPRVGVVFVSLTLAVEMAAVHRTVVNGFTLQDGSSARFVVNLFRFLIVLDVLRAVGTASGVIAGGQAQYWSDTATYGLFIACGVGLGFGFFSMTTSSLTQELGRLAATDPLTQVCNRRAFLEKCEKEFVRSSREQTRPSLLLLDLDHFKRFNDTFGHQAGDEALRASVERVQNAVRGIDTVCRWGGEELAVLLPNADCDAAQIVAERIRLSFAELHNRNAPEGSWKAQPLTVSIGTATWKLGEETCEGALGRADQALYAAKRSGRNRTVAYESLSPAMLAAVPMRTAEALP